MNIEQQLVILGHTQYVGRFYLAYRGSLDKLIELVRYSIGEAAPDPATISCFLRKESTQRTLELEHETALWQSSDRTKSWRLVCLAVQTDPEKAARLLNKRPPNSDCCCFCWQDERGVLDSLKPELDPYGDRVPGVNLHRQCSKPWKLLRDIIARAPAKTRESLL